MQKIDKLILEAQKRIRLTDNGVYIIDYSDGYWIVNEKAFQTLEEAKEYLSSISKVDDRVIIVNDIDYVLEMEKQRAEKEVLEDGGNQVENKQSKRSEENVGQNHKHDSKRKDRQQNRQYNHSWV